MIFFAPTRYYEYVSFDIFDTLIKRRVRTPADIFDFMERRCVQQGIPIEQGFRVKRRNAERVAAKKLDRPVTLGEIYKEFHALYGEDTDVYIKLEKEVELELCLPNEKIISIFRHFVRAGSYVVIISDMYLDSEFLSCLLVKCGVDGYKNIFVSCEYGMSKADGTLFPFVLQNLGITPDSLLHIGDNPVSDGLRARQYGIHTFIIPSGYVRFLSGSLYRRLNRQ